MRSARRRTINRAVVTTLAISAFCRAATLHVPADYPTIQACIDAAVSGVDECVVAPGTYHETINFLGKAITVHSSSGADVTTIDATGLNSSVVTCNSQEGPDTVLDSFTITGGTGTGSPVMYLLGGGMFNDSSSPTVTDCTFTRNMADVGGGMYNGGGSPMVTNCTFSGNTAYQVGGGMVNGESSPTVINCILWGDSRGEIVNLDESAAPTIGFSDVQGGLPGGAINGGGNIYVNPMFVRSPNPGLDGIWDGVDDDYGDLRLRAGSPCIDAGDPLFVAQPGETDLDGHARVLCGYVDMGAYEFGIGDFDCDDVVNLIDVGAWDVCQTGPLDPPSSPLVKGGGSGCEAFDFDGDGDVDLRDFAGFQQVFAGQ